MALVTSGLRTQRALAVRVGIHPARLSDILAGYRRPRPDEVARIYGALDIHGIERAELSAGMEIR